jgi:mono/diheme cytochrome c family protein
MIRIQRDTGSSIAARHLWLWLCRAAILAAFLAYTVASATALATVASSQNAPTQASAPSGKEVLQRRCFQCHQATMWSSVRGDRRQWLGVLYRMVGRGALWTEDEINAMADFLAQTRGPK